MTAQIINLDTYRDGQSGGYSLPVLVDLIELEVSMLKLSADIMELGGPAERNAKAAQECIEAAQGLLIMAQRKLERARA